MRHADCMPARFLEGATMYEYDWSGLAECFFSRPCFKSEDGALALRSFLVLMVQQQAGLWDSSHWKPP